VLIILSFSENWPSNLLTPYTAYTESALRQCLRLIFVSRMHFPFKDISYQIGMNDMKSSTVPIVRNRSELRGDRYPPFAQK
jgi:hypothetical protein